MERGKLLSLCSRERGALFQGSLCSPLKSGGFFGTFEVFGKGLVGPIKPDVVYLIFSKCPFQSEPPVGLKRQSIFGSNCTPLFRNLQQKMCDRNNCENRDQDDEDDLHRGRFTIAPTSTTSKLSRRKVSVVTLVEGRRKTSIYNWVNILPSINS